MLSKEFFEQLNSKISETIANSPVKDMEKNVKAMMVATFNKMDLVTREEFDLQQKILLKTREQLEQLTLRVATLETALNNSETIVSEQQPLEEIDEIIEEL